MKKKFISVLTALMVLTMGTTVFAGSPVTDVKPSTDDGTKVSSTTEYSAENKKAEETVKAAVEAVEKGATSLWDGELKVEEGREVSKDKPLTVTLEIPGVVANDNITVLHWDGQKWEEESTTVNWVQDGKVNVTFTSLSPIAVVKKAPIKLESPKPQNPAPAAPTADAATSPKTGAAAGAAAVAVIALAGAAVCKRKDN